MFEDDGAVNWRRALAVLLVVMALSVGALAFMGGQVGRVLSTVGASVGGPGFGSDPNDGGAGLHDDPGADAGSDPGSDGSDGSDGDAGGAGRIASLQDAARPDLLIIRTGSITIEVPALDAALDQAAAAVAGLGGYESGSLRSGRGDRAGAEVVYRFPAARWEETLAAIRDIGTEVRDEHSETADVSAEVVDVEARIRNLEVTEAAFQAIMDRAVAIDDVLNVQAELTSVRSEIEQLSSKAAQLREQAAMSTLTVAFVLPETPAVARQEARFDPGHEAEAATARLVELLQALATAGIWLGIVWLPVLAGLAIAGGLVFLVSRRLRNAASKVAIS